MEVALRLELVEESSAEDLHVGAQAPRFAAMRNLSAPEGGILAGIPGVGLCAERNAFYPNHSHPPCIV